ncbi:MAG: hypothetical protein BWY17_05121 [Deltaproteobacteria bacterium ADurb.Bin207]|nr:MAG: hypothetical protein BWY17_05121 [Deltaproteobacteria bacterium ADurb.Bin207]
MRIPHAESFLRHNEYDAPSRTIAFGERPGDLLRKTLHRDGLQVLRGNMRLQPFPIGVVDESTVSRSLKTLSHFAHELDFFGLVLGDEREDGYDLFKGFQVLRRFFPSTIEFHFQHGNLIETVGHDGHAVLSHSSHDLIDSHGQ